MIPIDLLKKCINLRLFSEYLVIVFEAIEVKEQTRLNLEILNIYIFQLTLKPRKCKADLILRLGAVFLRLIKNFRGQNLKIQPQTSFHLNGLKKFLPNISKMASN